MIDQEGYLKLTDFGLAIEKDVTRSSASTTKLSNGRLALEGTLEYTAPEILKGKPYDEVSECWSFGCLLYEMITGLPPFFSREQNRTAQKICQLEPNFKCFTSEQTLLVDLLHRLLTKDTNKRLQSINDILKHDWITKFISTDAIEHKRLEAPFVPTTELVGTDDTRFFH